MPTLFSCGSLRRNTGEAHGAGGDVVRLAASHKCSALSYMCGALLYGRWRDDARQTASELLGMMRDIVNVAHGAGDIVATCALCGLCDARACWAEGGCVSRCGHRADDARQAASELLGMMWDIVNVTHTVAPLGGHRGGMRLVWPLRCTRVLGWGRLCVSMWPPGG